jgi:hypothetical protein
MNRYYILKVQIVKIKIVVMKVRTCILVSQPCYVIKNSQGICIYLTSFLLGVIIRGTRMAIDRVVT